MSVRRRAIKARLEREERFMKSWRVQDDMLKAILALVQRKIAAGDKRVTVEELNACFPDTTGESHG